MLFHVTITHPQQDCPGRRSDDTPALIGDADRLEALGQELGVTSYYVVWGASCILWAQPEHVAHALVEAPNLEVVERYFASLTPPGWSTRSLPVFAVPDQLPVVRQVLAVPAAPVAVDDAAASDTLEGVTVDSSVATAVQHEEEPPPPPPPPPSTDSGAVTRFVESPSVAYDHEQSVPEHSPPAADQPAFGEGSTVILEPAVQRSASTRLVGTAGPAQGSVFEVGVGGATIGRLPQNTICLTDGRLSRQHARVEFRDGGFWLTDLASQNGTMVNGRPVSEAHRLHAGDSIELGTSRLTVMSDAEGNP